MPVPDLTRAALASAGGQVVLPEDPGYDDARLTFNGLVDRRPAAIVRPTDATGVAQVLRVARDARRPIGVRGGGHSVAGHAIVDGGVVIDLRAMRMVEVDPVRGVVHAGGGALWSDVDAPALAHGLAVPGGVFGDTGIGGLTLGGGIGFLMGIAGFTCDNLVGAQLVTADGTIQEVDAERDPDVLWALRGGGGNFGVVTRFDLALHPVGTFYAGRIQVPMDGGAVLRRCAAIQDAAPDELMLFVETFREDGTGRAMAGFQVAWMGDAATGAGYVRDLVADDPVTLDELRPMTYVEVQAINELMPFGIRHYWKSTFMPELDDAVIEAVVEATRTAPAMSGVLVEPIHGLARRLPLSSAAFPQRTARWHVSALGVWQEPAADEVTIAWTRASAAAFAAHSAGGTYVNYITPDEPLDRARTAYPAETLARLRQVKTRVDPDNVFRSNVNIRPGTD